MRHVSLAAALAALSACAAPPLPGTPDVTHFQSTETAGGGARWHIFLFDPSAPRSLDERLRLARGQIARERDCTWVDAPRDEIAARTAAQGSRYAETVLAAPLRCAA